MGIIVEFMCLIVVGIVCSTSAEALAQTDLVLGSAKEAANRAASIAIKEAERLYGRGIPLSSVRQYARSMSQQFDLPALLAIDGSDMSTKSMISLDLVLVSKMKQQMGYKEYNGSETALLSKMPHLVSMPTRKSAPAQVDLSCLPLMPPGTHTSVSYTPPDNSSAKNRTEAVWEDVLAAGMSGFAFDETWAAMEPTKGALNVSRLALVMHLLGELGLHSIVNLPAIDTDTVSVPADLADPKNPDRLRPGLAWNGSEVVDRYAVMLGQAVPLVVAHGGAHIGVGNEVDGTLQGLPAGQAVGYAVFAYIARAVARNMTGGSQSALSVGVTLTRGGLQAPTVRESGWFAYLSLPQVADALPVTYYPLNGDFSVEDPAVAVPRDMGGLLALLPGDRCVVMQELGFPSGYPQEHDPPSTDKSSQQWQADFFRLAFDQLGGAAMNGTGRVRFAGVDWLVDISPATCAQLEKYYRVTAPAFVEYLCSLGVVDQEGYSKLAAKEVVAGVRRTEQGSNTSK